VGEGSASGVAVGSERAGESAAGSGPPVQAIDAIHAVTTTAVSPPFKRERVTLGQKADCPAQNRYRAHDDEQSSEENERPEPPVHLTSQRIGIAFGGAANNQLGPSRLSEMKVIALAFDYIGQPLEQVDQLFIVDGDCRFAERLSAPVFDPHLMSIFVFPFIVVSPKLRFLPGWAKSAGS
jgi:hypothetical protein